MNEMNNKINLILKKFNEGNQLEAISEIESLLNFDNTNIELLFAYGVMVSKLNQLEKSIKCFEKILKITPNHEESLQNLYVNLLKINKFDESIIIINKLLNQNPKHYQALRDKAYIFYLKKDYSNADKLINKAIKIKDNEVFGINLLGLICVATDKNKIALNTFKKAILINKNYFDSYNNLGKCYFDNEDLENAFINFKKAHRINPKSELPIINIGNVLSLKDKYKFAINFYKKALEINPLNKLIIPNIAISYCRLKNLEQATIYYYKAKKLSPENYDLDLSYSYLLLHKKKFSEAWKLFESRLETKKVKKANIFHENIKHKISIKSKITSNDKILIVREQGVGDEILFSSMYNDLLNKYKNISIETDTRLIKIYERSFGRGIFFPSGHFSSSLKKIEDFNKILYAGSLTKYFRPNENSFNKKSYLLSDKVNDNKYKKILDRFNQNKKIGLSWKSVVNIYGRLKSLKIEDFTPLFRQNRAFINLQYGNVLDEIVSFKQNGFDIYNFENVDLFNDFESIISILKNLDLFVTVSNSTAHLAAALGIPTIVICPKKTSTYYYWDYNDGFTPWYNNVRVLKVQGSIKKTINQLDMLIDKII